MNIKAYMVMMLILICIVAVTVIYTLEQQEACAKELPSVLTKADVPKNIQEEIGKQYIEQIKNIAFNENDLRKKSNIEAWQLNIILNNTVFKGQADIFLEAEKKHGVNAFFLIALAGHESGWGTSRLAQDKNNYTGFSAYNHSPYESGTDFQNLRDCIMHTASRINEKYLTKGGDYHNGYGTEEVNIRYAVLDDGSPNYEWSKSINEIAKSLVKKIRPI